MRYPLHRSLVFWGGILVMGFVVWAWWDSGRNTVRLFARDYSLDARNSGVSVIHHGGFDAGFTMFRFAMSGPEAEKMRLARPGFVRWERHGAHRLQQKEPMDPALRQQVTFAMWGWASLGDGWICFIPHWLMLTGTAAVWLAVMAWRVRRWRKAMVVVAG